MRKFIIAALAVATAAPLAAPAEAQNRRDVRESRRDMREERREYHDARRDYRQTRNDWARDRSWRNDKAYSNYWRNGSRYDWNRPDPRYGGYDAARYYRQGNYSDRRLGRNDRIYAGSDGRYYCRRTDGTTGLIIGGILGGVIGNSLDGGRSSLLGTLLGAGGGAALGSSIDRGNVRCR